MKLIFDLLQQMSVFLVIAYLFTKSPAFRPLTGETLRVKHKVLLYFIFSAFSILGTYFGLPIRDAIANTRAIGAVLAGIVGGPLLGVAVGLTGGLHRYTLGGFTAFSCGVSTTVEGLLGGLVHHWMVRRGQSDKLFNPWVALVTTFVAEALQMAIILLLSRPFADAVALVQDIALPMMLANSTGAALFISIMRDQKSMYDKFGVMFSARALKIAERTLGILGKGVNRDTSGELARIIHQETGVGAVAITDRENILAFVGIGSDHHHPPFPITSAQTRRAISEDQIIYADGLNEHFECPISPTCPLGSALVIPVRLDNEVVGTIKLYEPKNKLFLNINRTLGEGIAGLLSEQLLRSRYEEQKSLLIKSELKLIQAQINPHFLFNALNTIISVTRKDADRARELLLHLSNFFRKNLKRSGDMATIEEELDHVRSYLKIEEARFETRLEVGFEVDPSLLSLKVPTFTLQPIIENAIKHGISAMMDAGKVTIAVRRAGEEVEIVIEDNAGNYSETPGGEGLGIPIVDRRIKNLYGKDFGVRTTAIPGELTRATIRIPLPAGVDR
jgi:two-component system, LytTR family, sensor kinase